MKQGMRKPAGTIAIVVSLLVYPWGAIALYEQFVAGQSQPVLLSYFVIAGLLWAVPAGAIIKWMSRPDKS